MLKKLKLTSSRKTYKCSRTPKRDVLFITGDWNAEIGSEEIPRITGEFNSDDHYIYYCGQESLEEME